MRRENEMTPSMALGRYLWEEAMQNMEAMVEWDEISENEQLSWEGLGERVTHQTIPNGAVDQGYSIRNGTETLVAGPFCSLSEALVEFYYQRDVCGDTDVELFWAEYDVERHEYEGTGWSESYTEIPDTVIPFA